MSKFQIRFALPEDMPEILNVYRHAREFMISNGNPTQWGNEHPREEVLREDIEKQQLYLLVMREQICGVFALVFGTDLTYLQIEGGCWRSDMPYATIHRIAGSGREKGIFEAAINFGKSRISHLRIDTHENNKVMQHLVEKHGFSRRGIIFVRDHSPRIAYDWVKE